MEGGDFLLFFFNLDVNSGLKCKCDLIVKNSKGLYWTLCRADTALVVGAGTNPLDGDVAPI